MEKETFVNELDFEKALVEYLSTKLGWTAGVLQCPTEKDLIKNWADILYNNNREKDRLDKYPLTPSEMGQIIDKLQKYRTPAKINEFINGRTVGIKRDNPDDKAHFGQYVYLKIFDRDDIAGGNSVYQIAEQPIFTRKNAILPDRRGDLMLLINGMPVIHIELKRSDVEVSNAFRQIEKYSKEGLFAGIFSLVQIFVAMNPSDMVYFANPGPGGDFNPKFFFRWADFNNEPYKNWRDIAKTFLAIPMAHQMIGFYTVPDGGDGKLKVMRSYQYYAASRISDIVSKTRKDDWLYKADDKGGYVWHTTGSGKTLTSFKSAQLIADSKDADKVLFVTDRIELGAQSLNEYKGFAGDFIEVSETDNTDVLISKILSNKSDDMLIVTSIQKLSNIKLGDTIKKNQYDAINKKRIVMIFDECHRSVFGEQLQVIRDTFKSALLFGFTGTPIQEENEKKGNDTSDIFGNEIHRYSISDGIRDGNVLGFDPTRVETYSQSEVREKVALLQAKAETPKEAIKDEKKKEIYYEFVNNRPMASVYDVSGKLLTKGIEAYLPRSNYDCEKHRKKVCEDILDNWVTSSVNYKYHAILATSSIREGCEYYRLLKRMMRENESFPALRIIGLFDNHDDDEEGDIEKKDAIVEMIRDYNAMFNLNYDYSRYQELKKDVQRRLAHKRPYTNINVADDRRLDLVIVVNQMLTGYDSKWVNSLYLDKELEYENIVQAFSRTNRICENDKPFGLIRYYRRPHTMDKRIEEAFRVYSGNKQYGIFVDGLPDNLLAINQIYAGIAGIFESAGIQNFESNPTDQAACQKFVLEFNKLSKVIESAKIQGFRWNKTSYKSDEINGKSTTINVELSEETFKALLMRYKELMTREPGDGGAEEVAFDIDPTIVATHARRIDSDYLESKFKKFLKEIKHTDAGEKAIEDLRLSLATLSSENQKYANIIIRDIQSGDLVVEEGTTFMDLILSYRSNQRDKDIVEWCEDWGVDPDDLKNYIDVDHSMATRDRMINSANIQKVVERLAEIYNVSVSAVKAKSKLNAELKKFLREHCGSNSDV